MNTGTSRVQWPATPRRFLKPLQDALSQIRGDLPGSFGAATDQRWISACGARTPESSRSTPE
jgi:hypothetical protein